MRFLDVLDTKQNFPSLLHEPNAGAFQFRRKEALLISEWCRGIFSQKERKKAESKTDIRYTSPVV